MTNLELAKLLADLDALAHSLGSIRSRVSLMLPPSSDIPPEVMSIARDGRVFGAVSRWRETAGVGVTEAKRDIERALAAELVK